MMTLVVDADKQKQIINFFIILDKVLREDDMYLMGRWIMVCLSFNIKTSGRF